MEKAFDINSILAYQYSTIFDQLLLLQLHVQNTECPCSLRIDRDREIGEYCEPKHMRSIVALARESIPMETDQNRIDYLRTLVDEGAALLDKMEDRLCGADIDMGNYLVWVRNKRKELEPFFYSSFCTLKPREIVASSKT